MPNHPARQAVANELAKLLLSGITQHMDTYTIEAATYARLAHGLLARADRIIEIVEKGDG